MLKYLIILLDDTSVSFCHYSNDKTEKKLMSLENLKAGIQFAMLENLNIQFVYPNYNLPEEYHSIIESVDNCKIAPPTVNNADVIVLNNWDFNMKEENQTNCVYVLRTCKNDFFAKYKLLFNWLMKATRFNIVFTDVESFSDEDIRTYEKTLEDIALFINKNTTEHIPQLNILTDRIMLNKMNNCNAGYETITMAPNGNLYICPAFYYDNDKETIGDIHNGIDIKNSQLYKIEYAPLCRICDAFHCKRCIYLNKKTTKEVNIPSYEQCAISHIERNSSRLLLNNLKKKGCCLSYEDIKDIDYIDPIENINN